MAGYSCGQYQYFARSPGEERQSREDAGHYVALALLIVSAASLHALSFAGLLPLLLRLRALQESRHHLQLDLLTPKYRKS